MNTKLKKKPKLSRKSQTLLLNLSSSAAYNGLMQEYGCGPDVDIAKAEFDESFEALKRRILKLETKLDALQSLIQN